MINYFKNIFTFISESENSECVTKASTTDPLHDIDNSDISNCKEGMENNEELVTNGDVEMGTPETDQNNDEAHENDDVEPSNKVLSQQKGPEEISENGSDNAESAAVSAEVSTESISEEVSTQDISEEVSNTDISKEVSTEGASKDVLESNSIKQENLEDQNKENIEVMPKIRLVSLDKLMAKPKKSVTFDSSIIILSSDEESPTQKPTDTIEQNGTLKSALKNSPAKKTEKDTTSKKDTKSDSDDNSTSLSRKSTRLQVKGEEKQKERIRLKSIFTRTKANEWKGKNACDSDSEEEKSSKSKKTVVDISDSSDDDLRRNKKNRVSKLSKKKSKSRENEIYIPLPIVKCERLQEICSKTDNVFSEER